MPLLTLSSSLSLYYEIFSSCSCTTQISFPTEIDNNKPWLLIIHPVWVDLTWLRCITENEEYLATFNMICFDQRDHGRTHSELCLSTDFNTLAADLAFGMQKLGLPPVHILGASSWSSDIAIRLAALFPEKVLSMFLCGLAPDVNTDDISKAFQECFGCLSTPETAEDWDEGIHALHYFFFEHAHHDEAGMLAIDEWTTAIIKRYPPSKSTKVAAVCLGELGRVPDPVQLKESVQKPVFVLHGKLSSVFSAAQAAERFSTYSGVTEESKFKLLDDAPLLFLPTHVTFVKDEHLTWIAPILAKQTTPLPACQSDLSQGLRRLSKIADQPEIADRDPNTSDSFHGIKQEALLQRKGLFDLLGARESRSFSLFGGGAPEVWTDASLEEKMPWRFSQRHELLRM